MSSKASPKICPYPFARMEIRAKSFVPCCHGWLTPEYHQLEVGENPWNGPAAQELRKRIYNGDYSLCRRDLCHTPITTLSENEEHEAPVSVLNQRAVEMLQTEMPSDPSSICVVADPRCNLACPSCRKDHIFTVNDDDKLELAATEKYLEQYGKDIEILRFAGDGEVFFSPWKRKMLAMVHPGKFPKIKFIELTTNGLFFDEENYLKLLPGTQFIRRVTVSMDAGNEETYERVRGGDWRRLMRNLQWMSELRQKKQLKRFQINFTLRKDNYKSLKEFVALGEELQVDSVKFMAFEPWARMAVPDYLEQAVHLPDHPEHGALRELWQQVINNKRVRWSLPYPQEKYLSAGV